MIVYLRRILSGIRGHPCHPGGRNWITARNRDYVDANLGQARVWQDLDISACLGLLMPIRSAVDSGGSRFDSKPKRSARYGRTWLSDQQTAKNFVGCVELDYFRPVLREKATSIKVYDFLAFVDRLFVKRRGIIYVIQPGFYTTRPVPSSSVRQKVFADSSDE
jgi:hypothetical protein